MICCCLSRPDASSIKVSLGVGQPNHGSKEDTHPPMWCPLQTIGRHPKVRREVLHEQLNLISSFSTLSDDKTAHTRSSRSRFPHDEMDTVLNKKERQRTMMASGAPSETESGVMFDWSRLWLWAAAPHGDRESHRLRPSMCRPATGDSESHKKLGKFVSHFSPRREAEREVPSHGNETA